MGILNIETKEEQGVKVEALFHDSKNLIKTSYNYSTQQLVVTFKKGNVYLYNEVPNSVYEDLKLAESQGSYVSRNIVNKYTTKGLGTINETKLSLLLEQIDKFKNASTL